MTETIEELKAKLNATMQENERLREALKWVERCGQCGSCKTTANEALDGLPIHKCPNDKLQEALREIIICVWSDDFKNSDAKLDAIDKRAEQALSNEVPNGLSDNRGIIMNLTNEQFSQEMSVRIAKDELELLIRHYKPLEKNVQNLLILRMAHNQIATMQENERLFAEVEKLKQWRDVALAIGDNAKRELERQRREEEDDQNEVSDDKR